MQKTKNKNQNGITLIALIVTIIILLILAGVAISILSGENGILSKAAESKVETRAGEVQEKLSLWKAEKIAYEYSGSATAPETLDQLVDRLVEEDLLTEDEKDLILGNEEKNIEATGKVTIGSKTVVFRKLLKLGEAYSDSMIGQKITYSANGQDEWIVFGKDTDGNILITTEEPIDNGFELQGGAYGWASYETELDTACSGYGGTIQGETVLARSIKMKDINYVVGLTPQTVTVNDATYNVQTFDSFSFGTTNGWNSTTGTWDSNTIDYYYPSLSESENGYWKKPTIDNEFSFEQNVYSYYCNWSSGEYLYKGTETNQNTIDATALNMKTENLKYVLGGNTQDSCFNPYLVGSRFLDVNTRGAYFYVAYVNSGNVGPYTFFAVSDASEGRDKTRTGSMAIRPIVVLPETLQVEGDDSGRYDLVQ